MSEADAEMDDDPEHEAANAGGGGDEDVQVALPREPQHEGRRARERRIPRFPVRQDRRQAIPVRCRQLFVHARIPKKMSTM